VRDAEAVRHIIGGLGVAGHRCRGRPSEVVVQHLSQRIVVGHLFVLFYEEPTLRVKFGADYEEYCRNLNRWWPRLRGWDK